MHSIIKKLPAANIYSLIFKNRIFSPDFKKIIKNPADEL